MKSMGQTLKVDLYVKCHQWCFMPFFFMWMLWDSNIMLYIELSGRSYSLKGFGRKIFWFIEMMTAG